MAVPTVATSRPRVVLRFGSASAEVGSLSADRRGALRFLTKEAERGLGLFPQSFSFFGSNGEVDSVPALQRVLQAAGDNPCELEVRERLEWKWAKIREMDERLQSLATNELAIKEAMRQQEERIMAGVHESIAKLREELIQADTKICQGLAPMVQCLSEDQMDLKSEIAEVKQELIRTDAKVCHGLAPMVQCLSEDQTDLKFQVTELQQDLTCTDAKVCRGLAPLVQCLSEDYTDLKSQIAELERDLINTDVKMCQGLAPLMQSLAEEQIDAKEMYGCIDPKVRQLEMAQVDTNTRLDCLKTKLDMEAAFSRLADITADCVTALGTRAGELQADPVAKGLYGSRVHSAVDLDCTASSRAEETVPNEYQKKWSPEALTQIPFGSKVFEGKGKDTALRGHRTFLPSDGVVSFGTGGLWPETAPFARRGLQLSRSTPHLLPPLQ